MDKETAWIALQVLLLDNGAIIRPDIDAAPEFLESLWKGK